MCREGHEVNEIVITTILKLMVKKIKACKDPTHLEKISSQVVTPSITGWTLEASPSLQQQWFGGKLCVFSPSNASSISTNKNGEANGVRKDYKLGYCLYLKRSC